MINLYNDVQRRALRRDRVFRDHFNPLEGRNDQDCRERWRFNRATIMEITRILSPYIEHPTRRSHALPPLLQTLCGLRFYASGAYYLVLGDTQNIAESTVCRAVWGVVDALVELSPQYIKFPASQAARDQVKAEFFRKKGIYCDQLDLIMYTPLIPMITL